MHPKITMPLLILILILILLLPGCEPERYGDFLKALREAGQSSCISFSGNIGNATTRGGRIQGITATGDAKISECDELLLRMVTPPLQPQ